MRSWSFWASSLVLMVALLAPAAVSAADATISGRGPCVHDVDGRRVAAAGRPVFVAVDGLANFGDLDVAHAPPLLIRVQGDVDIRRRPDGSLDIVLGGDDE